VTNKTTGKVDPAAWMDFGWDLDRRITTADDSKNSTSSCKRAAGSQTKVLQDGNLGRDDNFGQHVMAVLKSLDASVEDTVNLNARRRTFFLELENFSKGSNAQVPGKLHVGDDLAVFADGYVANGYWVSGAPTSFRLRGVITDVDVAPMIEGAVLAMKTDGTDGNLGGAIRASELEAAAGSMWRHAGICLDPTDTATMQQIVQTMQQSVDLVAGAPDLQDTTRSCDAISIGLGFAAEPIDVATPHSEADPDPCVK
jgi:hypothetical protein